MPIIPAAPSPPSSRSRRAAPIRWRPYPGWHLGRHSHWLNVTGIAWTAFISIILVMPPNELSGKTIAGVRSEDGKTLADVRKMLRSGALDRRPQPRAGENTTIGLVATNARLTKTEINRVALMADDGLPRAINPSHTTGDGDTVFSLATGQWEGTANVTMIGALAADAMAEAIVRAVSKAESLPGIPSARELGTIPARIK